MSPRTVVAPVRCQKEGRGAHDYGMLFLSLKLSNVYTCYRLAFFIGSLLTSHFNLF